MCNCMQVQISALEILPLAPPHKVIKLFTDGELAKHVFSCLQSSLSQVRVQLSVYGLS